MVQTQFARKVDPVIRSVLDGYGSYFTKPEVVRDVLSAAPNLGNVISNANVHAPGWGLDEVLKDAVNGRVTQQLQKTVPSKKYGIRLRQYENYAVGHGPRRWQRFDVMSLSELQTCYNWRRAHVAAEQAVNEVYGQIIDEMKKHGHTAVGSVLSRP